MGKGKKDKLAKTVASAAGSVSAAAAGGGRENFLKDKESTLQGAPRRPARKAQAASEPLQKMALDDRKPDLGAIQELCFTMPLGQHLVRIAIVDTTDGDLLGWLSALPQRVADMDEADWPSVLFHDLLFELHLEPVVSDKQPKTLGSGLSFYHGLYQAHLIATGGEVDISQLRAVVAKSRPAWTELSSYLITLWSQLSSGSFRARVLQASDFLAAFATNSRELFLPGLQDSHLSLMEIPYEAYGAQMAVFSRSDERGAITLSHVALEGVGLAVVDPPLSWDQVVLILSVPVFYWDGVRTHFELLVGPGSDVEFYIREFITRRLLSEDDGRIHLGENADDAAFVGTSEASAAERGDDFAGPLSAWHQEVARIRRDSEVPVGVATDLIVGNVAMDDQSKGQRLWKEITAALVPVLPAVVRRVTEGAVEAAVRAGFLFGSQGRGAVIIHLTDAISVGHGKPNFTSVLIPNRGGVYYGLLLVSALEAAEVARGSPLAVVRGCPLKGMSGELVRRVAQTRIASLLEVPTVLVPAYVVHKAGVELVFQVIVGGSDAISTGAFNGMRKRVGVHPGCAELVHDSWAPFELYALLTDVLERPYVMDATGAPAVGKFNRSVLKITNLSAHISVEDICMHVIPCIAPREELTVNLVTHLYLLFPSVVWILVLAEGFSLRSEDYSLNVEAEFRVGGSAGVAVIASSVKVQPGWVPLRIASSVLHMPLRGNPDSNMFQHVGRGGGLPVRSGGRGRGEWREKGVGPPFDSRPSQRGARLLEEQRSQASSSVTASAAGSAVATRSTYAATVQSAQGQVLRRSDLEGVVHQFLQSKFDGAFAEAIAPMQERVTELQTRINSSNDSIQTQFTLMRKEQQDAALEQRAMMKEFMKLLSPSEDGPPRQGPPNSKNV